MVQSINATTPLEEARAALGAAYDLKFTKAVAKVTAQVYERVKKGISEADWANLAPLIVQINRLKREKKATILAHVQQPPEIFFGVADYAGDNLGLLRQASAIKRPLVVAAGVHSMAETLSLLLPRATVLSPDSRARCNLAASITPEDVLAIQGQYPGVKVLAHVNTSIAVKAIADATFTSANALAVVEAMPGDKVIMVPDQFLAQNIARQTGKKIITWAGSCDVHSAFDAETVATLRRDHPDAKVLAHPQSRPAVVEAADFAGSSAAMAKWLKSEKPARAVILSDIAVSANLAPEVPETEFIVNGWSPHEEKRLSLETILWSLHSMTEKVAVPADLAVAARAAVQKMLEISRRAR